MIGYLLRQLRGYPIFLFWRVIMEDNKEKSDGVNKIRVPKFLIFLTLCILSYLLITNLPMNLFSIVVLFLAGVKMGVS